MLMGGIAIRLQCGDQRCDPRCKNDEVAGTCFSAVSMWHARWHKYCGSGPNAFGSVGVAEREFSVEHMPSFIIGMVYMQCCWPAASPFMNAERIARSRESRRSHSQILNLWQSQ